MKIDNGRLYSMIGVMYQYFYRKFYDNPSYSFNPKERDIKLMDNFINGISTNFHKDSIGANYLFGFFCFQFRNWLGIDEFDVKKRKTHQNIQLSWLIGNKALNRWLSKKSGALYSSIKEMNRLGYNYSDLGFEDEIDPSGISDHEELYKSYYYNTDGGFDFCISTTTLFNPKSKLCQTCKFKDECKVALRDSGSELYYFRELDE